MKLVCCEDKRFKKEIDRLINFLKIISEENRLKVLCILKKQEMCVCDIWQLLGLPQNLVSHHLKVLKDFGLVKTKKQGTKVIYFVDKKTVDQYYSFLGLYLIK